MKNTLLATAAIMSLALSVPAMAQSSGAASNIAPSDTHSTIAPRLPTPPVSADAGPRQYLTAARDALATHRTGEAQEALERAEARLLDRSTSNPGVDQAPMVRHVADAREALGRGDVTGAQRIVDAALAEGPAARANQAAMAPMAAPMPGGAADIASGAAGTPSAIAGMPAAGVTVYDNHELPLPSTDDSMTFSGKSGDNSYTVRATGANPTDDVGPAADTSN